MTSHIHSFDDFKYFIIFSLFSSLLLLSILLSNSLIYVLFSILWSTVIGHSTNLMLTMFFFKAIYLKMFSWLNHQYSLIVIIMIMCANFAKLSTVSSKHHEFGIMSSIDFLSTLALPTLVLTHHYLSSILVVS